MSKPFTASQFTATKFSTAAEKADIMNKLAAFAEGGFKRPQFTKALYSRLSNMFMHIAHYDINGFYDEWFADETSRLNWLYYIKENGGMCGSPEHTWVDAERAFLEWLKEPAGNRVMMNAQTACGVC